MQYCVLLWRHIELCQMAPLDTSASFMKFIPPINSKPELAPGKVSCYRKIQLILILNTGENNLDENL